VGSNPIARSSISNATLAVDRRGQSEWEDERRGRGRGRVEVKAEAANQTPDIAVCMASWPSGKARVCKTLITGSNPVDASQRAR
jgi:hypothetical protein